MLVLMYAATTNTVEGIYDISDFYELDRGRFVYNYEKAVHIGEYNFDNSDDMSSLTITLKEFHTTDSNIGIKFNPQRITHIITDDNWSSGIFGPNQIISRTMSYSVDSVEYEGYNQITFHLTEDPVIAHIQELINTKVLIKRTNDPNLFYLNDVVDVANNHTLDRLQNIEGAQPKNLTGSWVLYTFQGKTLSELNTTALFFSSNIDVSAEVFDSLGQLYAKYPQAETTKPDSYYYYGKYAKIGATVYQCVYCIRGNTPILPSRLEWRIIPTLSSTFDTVQVSRANTKLTPGDIDTFSFALPVASNIKYYDEILEITNDLLPAYQFDYFLFSNSIVADDLLISRRVISGNILGIDGTFRPTGGGDMNYLYISGNSPQYKIGSKSSTVDTWPTVISPYFLSMNNSFELWDLDASSPKNAEPFRKYYLSAFGQNIPLPYRAVMSGVTVSSVISATNWHLRVHNKNNINEVFYSGDLSPTMLTTIDKFDEYLSQNSTYNTGKWVNTVLGGGTRIASGALSGFIAGNFVGAGIGIGAGIVSLGQQVWNYNLQEKAMRDAPDTIKGNSTTYDSTLLTGYGVYLYAMVATSPAMEIMETELDIKGFEVNHTGYIKDLTPTANDAIGECVYFAGRLLGVIYNYHTTQRLTQRLEGGIYLKNIPIDEEEE